MSHLQTLWYSVADELDWEHQGKLRETVKSSLFECRYIYAVIPIL